MAPRLRGSGYIDSVVNFICNQYDNEGCYHWTKTADIIRGLGLDVNDRNINNARNTLNYLVKRELAERRGTGKFEWRATDKAYQAWNRDEQEAFPETPPEDNGDTPEKAPSVPENAPITPSAGVNLLEKQMEALKGRVSDLEVCERAYIQRVAGLVEEMEVLRKEVNTTKVIEIKQKGKPKVVMDGLVPEVFDRVLDLANCRKNILLVGPAGCGKTTIAELISKALSLQFGAVVCTAGMSESHILGKELQNLADGTSKFRGSDFVTCYEEGGIYLFDELDAADPNVLLCVNTALSNGYVNLPGRPKKSRAKQHADFICIATANTCGRGANRQYSGRNQLDESTLDRFRIGLVECDYDKRIEKMLCPDDALLTKLWKIREEIEKNAMKRILSTRFIKDAYDMKSEANWQEKDILQSLFSGWTSDEIRKVGHGPTTTTSDSRYKF